MFYGAYNEISRNIDGILWENYEISRRIWKKLIKFEKADDFWWKLSKTWCKQKILQEKSIQFWTKKQKPRKTENILGNILMEKLMKCYNNLKNFSNHFQFSAF